MQKAEHSAFCNRSFDTVELGLNILFHFLGKISYLVNWCKLLEVLLPLSLTPKRYAVLLV